MMLARRYPVLVEPEELYKRIKDKDPSIFVIDVRREEEYTREHIPGAVSLPLARVIESMDPLVLASLFSSIGLDVSSSTKHVIVYDDTFGALAARVAWTLEYLGYERVSLLSVTYNMWKELGFDLEYGKSNSSSSIITSNSNLSISVNSSILADYEYIKSIVESKSRKSRLLDVRERLNYLDHHIPNAINIPWKAFSAEDRILKSKDEIARMLRNRKISMDDEVVVYCGSVGTLSGLSYYALRLVGHSNVRLYAKSLKEWRSLNLPLEGFKDAHYWDLSAE
jgi:thiosulfate/3-mercaptopyruvate sulfurtransferase